MRINLMIEGQEGVTWAQWVALAEAVEDAGLEGLFRSDHYRSIRNDEEAGSLDAWTTLAGLARAHQPHPARDDGLAGHIQAGLGAREERRDRRPHLERNGSSWGSAPAGSRRSTRRTASTS